jgi:hypothetical protein
MPRRKKQPKKQKRRDQGQPPKGCPLEKPKAKTPKPPLVERTTSRGLVELKFPGFEATFPATNRSIMIIVCVLFCTLTIVVPVVVYLFVSADPETLAGVGHLLGTDEKPREPVKMPVKTDDGIEIIEVCPPCPDWDQEQCEERFGECGVICPQCPVCPACPVCQPAVPPAMAAPRKGDAPLL